MLPTQRQSRHACPPPLLLIAGPCVIESERLCLEIAQSLASLKERFGIQVIFKASYDKANRTSRGSYRGPGREKGLRILAKVRRASGLLVLTDIHEPADAAIAAETVDVLQIPAFLCRQTDLLAAAGATGKTVNIKKGQFMAPGDMQFAIDKVGGRSPVWLTERGTFFGYHRLVVDFAGMIEMQRLGVPVIFDATHSVQAPGGGCGKSTGNRAMALPLARAAVAAGANGLFFEVHPFPGRARCDADNTVSLASLEKQLPLLLELRSLTSRALKT